MHAIRQIFTNPYTKHFPSKLLSANEITFGQSLDTLTEILTAAITPLKIPSKHKTSVTLTILKTMKKHAQANKTNKNKTNKNRNISSRHNFS